MKKELVEVTRLCLKCYEEITSITQARYSTAWNLIYEAGRCHRGDAYVAAAVTCRGALEATLHEAFAWEMKGGKLYLRSMVKYWRPGLEQLIQWAGDVSLLTQVQLKIAREIQREGNFAPHLRQKIYEELSKLVFKGKPIKSYRLWTDKQESWWLLNKTVNLLIAIVKKAVQNEMEDHSLP